MSPAAEVKWVVLRELRRSFRSAKGIVLVVLCLLGGGVGAALAGWFEKLMVREATEQGQDLKALKVAALVKYYDEPKAKYLADAPESLSILLQVTVWLTPLLVALLCFDTLSSDLQHRAIRYWMVRCRRESFYLGKLLGSWAAISAITLAMSVVIWVTVGIVGPWGIGNSFSWGIRFYFVSLPLSLAWCSIAACVGSQFRTPILSLLVIFAAFFVLFLVLVIGGISGNQVVLHLYPNYYDRYLLGPGFPDVLKGLGGSLAFASVATVLGMLLLRRRDV